MQRPVRRLETHVYLCPLSFRIIYAAVPPFPLFIPPTRPAYPFPLAHHIPPAVPYSANQPTLAFPRSTNRLITNYGRLPRIFLYKQNLVYQYY